MRVLEENDRRHVEAAEGWLDLGNWDEGRKEILLVRPRSRTHPEVIRVCLELLIAMQQWEKVAEGARILCMVEPDGPQGWFFLATALHRMDRTSEAREILVRVVDRFADAFPLHYSLARYCCRLGNLNEARRWWKKAAGLTDGKKLREVAADDPDLRELCEAGLDG